MRLAAAALGCWAFLAMVVTTPAVAQRGFSLRAEGGAGAMVSSYQRDTLGFDELSYSAAVRAGGSILSMLLVQASLEHWLFPADGKGGAQVAVTAGLRYAPALGSLGVLFVDANAGAGFTGEVTRPTFNAGLGMELGVAGALHIGPFVRYGRTLTAEGDAPPDAQYVTGGLTFALHPVEGDGSRRAAPLPMDRDADEFVDGEDACPGTPAGEAPDPDRPGCPGEVRDSDGDGVSDAADACPEVAGAEAPDPDRPGCPLIEVDRDHDGIADAEDACPDEPAGARGDRTRPGCPRTDRDGDTIGDADDRCPDEPGVAFPEDRRGCPALAQIAAGAIELGEPIQFGIDSARILSESDDVLRAVADLLQSTPEIRRVIVEGHTDATGDARYNRILSRRRAEAVRRALVRLGVSARRLEARGLGSSQPLVSGGTPAAMAANRRVELRIVDRRD